MSFVHTVDSLFGSFKSGKGFSQGNFCFFFEFSGLSGRDVGLFFFDIGSILFNFGNSGFFSDDGNKFVGFLSSLTDGNHLEFQFLLESLNFFLGLGKNHKTLFESLNVHFDISSLLSEHIFVEIN